MSPPAARIGALDLHLFGEGTHRRLWELLGPRPIEHGPDGGWATRFGVWAPNARSIAVVGDWGDWVPEALEPVLSDGPTGIWATVSDAPRPGDRYLYEITTAQGRTIRRSDPMARRTQSPASDVSVIPDVGDFEWSDDDWLQGRGRVVSGEAPLRIYEVHLGSWRRSVDDWSSLAIELGGHVARLGFTHVELLGADEHPTAGSWVAEVAGHYAPTARFGPPEEMRRFVDTLHGLGVGVILDWLPSRFPVAERSLGRFDGSPLYERGDSDAALGEHRFDLGCAQVRNFLLANALYWLDEFHVDGLRFDSVSAVLRGPGAPADRGDEGGESAEDPHGAAFVREVCSVVGEEFGDVLMIAEESTAWPGVTRPTSAGGLGFSHTWNLGWAHDTLEYLALAPEERPAHHDRITFPLLDAPDERFVLPITHHDVGGARGAILERLGGDDAQRFAALRALFALQWSMPGAPMVFMGSELAPWQGWNPTAELPWHLLDHPSHRGVHDLVVELNRRCATWSALWRSDTEPAGLDWLDAHDAPHSTFAFLRRDLVDGDAPVVVAIANLSGEPRSGYRVGVSAVGSWEVVVDSDDSRWWGSGHRGAATSVTATDDPWQGQPASVLLDVGPMSVVWLAGPAAAS